MKKLTQEEFLSRYQSMYSNLLFDKALYINESTPVEIGCKTCGRYRFISIDALRNKKAGCPNCNRYPLWLKNKEKGLQRRKENFLKSSYSSKFIPNENFTKITCKKCQKVYHIGKKDSFTCSCEHPFDTNWFINKSKERFGDKFLYNKAIYKNTKTSLILGCSRCGRYFEVKPNWHFYTGYCPYCNESRSHGYSKESIDLFNSLSKLCNINIRHSQNGREYSISYKIDNTIKRTKVDGFCQELNLILEFNGDLFHGNPKIFKPEDKCHPYKDTPAKVLFQKTLEKEKILQSLGYNIISIWEYDYNLDRDTYIRNLVNKINILKENYFYEN